MSCLAGFMPEESLLDLLENPSFCHSEGAQSATEESLNESLVAKRDSSPLAGVQNDKLTTFTKNPKSNDSQKAHSNSSVITIPSE